MIKPGRSLAAPSPSVADDAGHADPALLAALAAPDVSAVYQALSEVRVFVPVAAQLVSADRTGADKQSDMALLLLDGPTGQALPVFSSVAAFAGWAEGQTAGARPVAVAGSDALGHAAAETLAAIVVDVAGPHPTVLELGVKPAYRPGTWSAGKRLTKALRRCGAVEAYLLDVGSDGRPAIGLVLPPGIAPAAVVERFAGELDRPVDVALLDEPQRQEVRAAGVASVI
jgi:ribosomal protein S18 acetylase RimI-like enzyme